MKTWVISICLATVLIGLVYATAQHILRMDANDPQIQMAEDISASLSKRDRPLRSPDSRNRINPTQSLSTFVMVYDNNKKLIFSNTVLDTDIPSGVLDNVKTHGEERLTWQPKPGVRIATVVEKYDKGYVVVGRSLREVEQRIGDVTLLALAALLVSWIVVTVPYFFVPLKAKQKTKQKKK